MNKFIEQNKKLLKFYCTALRLSGWILLTLGLCSFASSIIILRYFGITAFATFTINAPLRFLPLILFGILGLGIAQLIQYCFNSKAQPGFILRYGDKFLYIYVVLILIVMIIRSVCGIKFSQGNDVNNAPIIFFCSICIATALFAAKALILIGMAQFLKRLIPIIEEHKSLV